MHPIPSDTERCNPAFCAFWLRCPVQCTDADGLREVPVLTDTEIQRVRSISVLYNHLWRQRLFHPARSSATFFQCPKDQLQSLGYSFDWDREINTTDPEYYHWTQWIFLKLFKAGLAYKKEMPINWCTSCKVGLANEEVVNGVCERCGSPVVRKVKSEWMLKITEYADKLIDGLDGVDYIERVKTSQKNWIGRSHGAEVDFSLKDKPEKLTIYTTRPDTLTSTKMRSRTGMRSAHTVRWQPENPISSVPSLQKTRPVS